MRMGVSVLFALRLMGIGSRLSLSNARKSLIGAVAGIGISLVPLIAVLVVADGMIEGISGRIIELSSGHLRVADYSGLSDASGDAGALESLRAELPRYSASIADAAAERQGLGIAIGPKGRSGSTIRAVSDAFFSRSFGSDGFLRMVAGTGGAPEQGEAVIGEKLAETVGLAPGDRIRLLTIHRSPSGKETPKFASRTVRSVVSSGYQELDALWVFVPFASDSSILDPDTAHSFISVYTDDPYGDLSGVRDELLGSLPDGFDCYTWKELNRSQLQSFNTTRILLLFIMFLILCIASVNVSSALVMTVMERRKEIAILKSIGAHPSDIAFAFVLAGFFTGLGGVVAGLPLGILCALNINEIFSFLEQVLNGISGFAYALGSSSSSAPPAAVKLLDPAYYIQGIPVRLDAAELYLVAAGTLLLSSLVSIFPALRAGSEKPLDTLRKV